MNRTKQFLVIGLAISTFAAMSSRAEQAPKPPKQVYKGHFEVADHQNLNGNYEASFYAPHRAVLSFRGKLYYLNCKSEGPMGELGCAENVHVGYNPRTGLIDGAYSFSTSDTGQIYLGVNYGPGNYVQIGTLQLE